MEPLLESIDLDLEESNELAFKIKVEGASSAPAKVRLVCEAGDVSYMFNGYGTSEDGVVQFVLPQMNGKMTEGTYQARVEVLIENRYFSPVSFSINFKKAMKVVAESMQVTKQLPKAPAITVSAQPIFPVKPSTIQSVQAPLVEVPLKIESRPIQKEQVRDSTVHPTTLKERYVQKAKNQQIDDESIAALAKAFLSSKKKR